MEECERYSAADHKLKNMQVSDMPAFIFSLHSDYNCIYWKDSMAVKFPLMTSKTVWKQVLTQSISKSQTKNGIQ